MRRDGPEREDEKKTSRGRASRDIVFLPGVEWVEKMPEASKICPTWAHV
jgi:hypothetical protein